MPVASVGTFNELWGLQRESVGTHTIQQNCFIPIIFDPGRLCVKCVPFFVISLCVECLHSVATVGWEVKQNMLYMGSKAKGCCVSIFSSFRRLQGAEDSDLRPKVLHPVIFAQPMSTSKVEDSIPHKHPPGSLKSALEMAEQQSTQEISNMQAQDNKAIESTRVLKKHMRYLEDHGENHECRHRTSYKNLDMCIISIVDPEIECGD